MVRFQMMAYRQSLEARYFFPDTILYNLYYKLNKIRDYKSYTVVAFICNNFGSVGNFLNRIVAQTFLHPT